MNNYVAFLYRLSLWLDAGSHSVAVDSTNAPGGDLAIPKCSYYLVSSERRPVELRDNASHRDDRLSVSLHNDTMADDFKNPAIRSLFKEVQDS